MDCVLIRDLFKDPAAYTEGEITVTGWVRSIRDSKSLGFIVLHDGTCFNTLQVVYEASKVNNFEEISHVPVGSSLIVKGQLILTPGARQPFELHALEVAIEGLSTSDYPLQKKRHTMEYLRTIGHLRPRTNTFQAVFRVRSLAAFAIHKFFQERGFVYVNTPIVTGSDAEGAGEMFQLTTMDLNDIPKTDEGKVNYNEDFFGKMASLTVSGQLNAETFATAFRNVYTFGPTFRAENSHTTRHLAEFWMIEPEIAFADLAEDARLAEEFLKYLFRAVLNERSDDLAFIAERVDKNAITKLEDFINAPFERIDYTDAVSLLQKSGRKFDFPVEWGLDLQTEHERWLTEEHVGRPVVVTNYPEHIKAFYMRLNDDGKTVAAMDVLAPGIGEIIGGSQREERLDVLDARMAQFGLDREHYSWYRDFRRYGSVPHAGFGLGFERLVVYVCGLSNIRDAIPYPRAPGSADF